MCPFFSTCMAFVYIIITSPLGYPGLSKRAPAFCLTCFCPCLAHYFPVSNILWFLTVFARTPSVRWISHTCLCIGFFWSLSPGTQLSYLLSIKNLRSTSSWHLITNHTKQVCLLLPFIANKDSPPSLIGDLLFIFHTLLWCSQLLMSLSLTEPQEMIALFPLHNKTWS